ncbi:MAG: hypothetical protein KTR22_08085 [Flavobacteriaceae bacterium]|nr:hypothetical protein [Flavobacteriaceae bacterium]
MKKILFLLLLASFAGQAQEYVDLFKVGYGQTFNNDFEGTNNSTEVKTFEVDLTFPVVLNDLHALITGGLFSRNNLQLFPQAEFSSLYSSTLKLGWAATWNEKWSSTLVALPKIASDYKDIDGDDFYLGGVALLKYQKKENLIYRFGLYASSEAFGVFSTPIFGWYYLSPSSQFEMDVSLPVSADINYTEGVFTYGLDYYGIGRSFNIDENNANVYADLSSLEFASYIQFNAFDKSVLLRAKFGYASNDYEVYEQGEKIDLGIAAFSFGDDRTQLNPNIGGGLFLRFEAIYRFNLPGEDDDPEKK